MDVSTDTLLQGLYLSFLLFGLASVIFVVIALSLYGVCYWANWLQLRIEKKKREELASLNVGSVGEEGMTEGVEKIEGDADAPTEGVEATTSSGAAEK